MVSILINKYLTTNQKRGITVINSGKLNALGSYWSSLVDLIESLNKFNSQKIDPIYDRELFIRMCYDWQEKIMLKIYEFLPVKIDITRLLEYMDTFIL